MFIVEDSAAAILEKFRNGQQNTLAEIRSAIAASDWEKAERLAHTLKGLLGTLGAGKLKGKAAELETAIRRMANVQAESLLPEIELKLTQLFAAIDSVLQLRAEEKEAGGEIADTATPAFLEELISLIHKAVAQLEQFDSRAEDTVTRICRMVGHDAEMKKALASIEQHISGYKYEQGLAELTTLFCVNGK